MNQLTNPIQIVNRIENQRQLTNSIKILDNQVTTETVLPESQQPKSSISPYQNAEQQDANMKKKFTTRALSEILLQNAVVVRHDNNLYIYDVDYGYFKPLFTSMADQYIRSVMPHSTYEFLSVNSVNEIVRWLYSMALPIVTEQQKIYATYCINFRNGYLNLTNNVFYTHKPNTVFFNCLNVDYDVNKINTLAPVFEKFLETSTGGDTYLQSLMLEHLGYCISNFYDLKMITIFFGPSDSGKSKWLQLIKEIIGNDFVKSIPLQSLSSNFRTVELVGAKANIFAEVDSIPIKDAAILKTLSSGGSDRINCDVKNGKPIEFENMAKLVFSSNTLEFLNGFQENDALIRRMLIIPIDHVLPENERITNLSDLLKAELPQIIVNYVIPALRRLYSNNFVFTKSYAVENAKKQLGTGNNKVIEFLVEFCTFASDQKCHKDILYEYYMNFIMNEYPGTEPASPADFKKLVMYASYYIKNILPIRYGRFRIGEDNKHGFFNIGIKDLESKEILDT